MATAMLNDWEQSRQTPSEERASILLLEDDSDTRQSMAQILTDEGYDVITAENGQDALDRLGFQFNPDLILLDLMMPVLNGFDFLTEIRLHPEWSFIPVIVASANQGYEAADLKSFAVLRKPFDLSVLLESVRRAIDVGRTATRN